MAALLATPPVGNQDELVATTEAELDFVLEQNKVARLVKAKLAELGYTGDASADTRLEAHSGAAG